MSPANLSQFKMHISVLKSQHVIFNNHNNYKFMKLILNCVTFMVQIMVQLIAIYNAQQLNSLCGFKQKFIQYDFKLINQFNINLFMKNTIPEDPGNAYAISIPRKKHHKAHPESTKNSSLPSINSFSEDKVNSIRRQLQQTNSEITKMKARINALNKQKLKHQQKKNHNLKEIQFMKTVKDRMFQDMEYWNRFRAKRKSEVQQLHQKATSIREKMIKQREKAKSIIKEQKSQCALTQRKRKNEDQQFIIQMKTLDQQKNRLKAKQIKKYELELEQKKRQFHQSRIQFSKNNHLSRIKDSLRQKRKAQRLLDTLRSQRQSLVDCVKQSQQQMLQTLYEIQSINPEKSKSKSRFHKNSTQQLKLI